MKQHSFHVDWTEEVRNQLSDFFEHIQQDSSRKIAVFDFDNTCIHNDIGDALFDWMICHRSFSFSSSFWELLGKRKEIVRDLWQKLASLSENSVEFSDNLSAFRFQMHACFRDIYQEKGQVEAYAWIASTLVGLTEEEVYAFSRKAAKQALYSEIREETLFHPQEEPILLHHGVRFREAVTEIVFSLQLAGVEVWICSASHEGLVRVMAHKMGIPPHQVIGVRLQKDLSGLYCSSLDGVMTSRQGKVQAIERIIQQTPCWVAGDSQNDEEMLQLSSHMKILMAPKPSEFLERARSRGWSIQPTFDTLNH